MVALATLIVARQGSEFFYQDITNLRRRLDRRMVTDLWQKVKLRAANTRGDLFTESDRCSWGHSSETQTSGSKLHVCASLASAIGHVAIRIQHFYIRLVCLVDADPNQGWPSTSEMTRSASWFSSVSAIRSMPWLESIGPGSASYAAKQRSRRGL